jgi:chondroitin 4-sulfotransferase 11
MREAVARIYRRVPESVRLAILVKRRERIWLDRGILFIHVPKAAGTSINQALYGMFMGHPRASDVEKWGGDRLRRLPRFAVVRNPWSRLVSAYRFARRGGGIGAISAGIRDPEQYRVGGFDSFESFVHEWLAPRDVNRLDGVFRPQYLYVSDRSGRLLVDHVGRLENLVPTYDFIQRTTGETVEPRLTNWSGETVDYRGMYSAEMQSLVGRIYHEDVRRFGYDF